MRKFFSLVFVNVLFFIGLNQAFSDDNSKIGFLVIAQDRGYLGNKDIQILFEKFKNEYTASLVFIGRNYDGIGSEYSEQVMDALSKFNPEKISKIIVLPLFLSNSNHILKKIQINLPSYNQENFEIKWVPTMSESYLIAQILLDRINLISKDSENERLAILGMGAVDEGTEQLITKEYEKLIEYIKERKTFKEVNFGVYYDYGVSRKIRKKKNKEVDDRVIRTAAKKGRTLLVPFLIGPKYSHSMSMTHWLKQKFDEFDIEFSHEDIIGHPNVFKWMKKVATENTFNENSKIGIVVMAHGATVPYNEAVEKVIHPLKKNI